MVNVILHAKSSLRLAFPFIDMASADVLKQLEYAWRRGCSVQVLSQRSTDWVSNETSSMRCASAALEQRVAFRRGSVT